MTIRTKIWLIAVSVAVTVGVASWGRMYLTRSQIIKDAQTAAEELAHDIAEDLKSVQADADDRDLEEKLLGYLNRHSRIVRLDLYVYREAYTPSSRIAAPRGDRPEITRFAPFVRQPLGFTRGQTVGSAQEQPIELPVDLQGPWKATLVMKWTLGQVEAMLKKEEQISLIFAAVFVVGLTLVSGLITQRIIGRPLEALAAAMRDVEGGDLGRRLSVDNVDEVGRLSHGFNRMLERLSLADAQIRAFNQRLAAEIEAATHNLSEKNATLAQLNRLLNDMRLDNASKVRLATLGQLAAQLAHESARRCRRSPGTYSWRCASASCRRRCASVWTCRRRDRTHQQDRARLPGFDASAGARAPGDGAAAPAGRSRRDRSRRRPGQAGSRASSLDVAPGVGDVVTDPGLLRQIVVNLLSNALDAVDRNGNIELEAHPVDDDILIRVSDTGHGIAPDDLRRIFEPFYTTKGRGKGTGLGLAICRQLTAALGGTISVESEAGKGSTFFVRIPRKGRRWRPGRRRWRLTRGRAPPGDARDATPTQRRVGDDARAGRRG